MNTNQPLITIVGPTASGKTSIAVELAEKLGGEIVCADSRTVYKGIDIGTAKPGLEERRRVPHWGLDIVDPDQPFTVSDFKNYADEKIAEIRSRGKIPFLVGGSGLYIDAVIFDYTFGDKADSALREELERLSLEELYEYCNKSNVLLPENVKNKRYVIRAIERKNSTIKRKKVPIGQNIIVGIATERTILFHRINERTEQLFAHGVVDEASELGKKYGWNHESMTGNIYPLVHSYIDGETTLSVIKEKFQVLDRRLAKRQLTWFRSNPHIVWLSNQDVADYIESKLAAHS